MNAGSSIRLGIWVVVGTHLSKNATQFPFGDMLETPKPLHPASCRSVGK